MSHRPTRPRGFYRIDDRTGFKVRADRTVKEWDGTIVAREDFEARHPQDFVRGRRDTMAVPDPRPEPADVFQYPPGGPFMMIHRDGDSGACIPVIDGLIQIYRGVDQLVAGDL